MKKALTILFVSLSLVIILDSLNIVHALAMFFLVGLIPGTNMTISADRMFELFTVLIGFTLSRVTVRLMRVWQSADDAKLENAHPHRASHARA